jgi:hypothetical protein
MPITPPKALEQVKRYEAEMRYLGMMRVHVWVPTPAHGDTVKRRASEMREQYRAAAGIGAKMRADHPDRPD